MWRWVIVLAGLGWSLPGMAADASIEMETVKIRGNRELPRVLYIVPWKKAPVGDLVGRPVESLLDEVLAPLDRDVFVREVEYYESLQASRAAAKQK